MNDDYEDMMLRQMLQELNENPGRRTLGKLILISITSGVIIAATIYLLC